MYSSGNKGNMNTSSSRQNLLGGASSSSLAAAGGTSSNSLDAPGNASSAFSAIDKVRDVITQLDNEISDLRRRQQRVLQSIEPEEQSRAEEKLARTVDEINRKNRWIRMKLKKMDGELKRYTGNDYTARQNQHRAATQAFMAAIQRLSSEQLEFKDRQQKALQRQWRILHPDATEEELQSLGTEYAGARMFAMDMASDMQERFALEEARARHDEMLSLEKSVEELAQLFLDMQDMVNSQGEQVVTITQHVEESREATQKASKELKDAVVKQKKRRRLKWIIACCCVLLLLIVGIVVFVEVGLPIIQASNSRRNSS